MATGINDFVSVQTAAFMLGVSDGRIRQLVGTHEGGELPAQKLNRKAWIIAKSELRKFARKHGIELREDIDEK